jgi:hypothetical protein
MAKRAVIMLRDDPHYRRDAFAKGLRRVGFEIMQQGSPGPSSVLVLWNRKAGREEQLAEAYERSGATVLIAENGYIGKDKDGHQLYAISRGGHNGSGQWFIGEQDRWAKLGIELKPWREPFAEDGYVLVCGQRGIGSRTMASPGGWHTRVVHEQGRLIPPVGPFHIRPHPGNNHKPATTLEQDFAKARGVLVWSSSSGVKALVAGLPVCYAAPRPLAWLKGPREEALRRMAWAQWTLEEIADGTAFECLLNNDPNS